MSWNRRIVLGVGGAFCLYVAALWLLEPDPDAAIKIYGQNPTASECSRIRATFYHHPACE